MTEQQWTAWVLCFAGIAFLGWLLAFVAVRKVRSMSRERFGVCGECGGFCDVCEAPVDKNGCPNYIHACPHCGPTQNPRALPGVREVGGE